MTIYPHGHGPGKTRPSRHGSQVFDVTDTSIGNQVFNVSPGGPLGCVATARFKLPTSCRNAGSFVGGNCRPEMEANIRAFGRRMNESDKISVGYIRAWARNHVWVRREHWYSGMPAEPNWATQPRGSILYRETERPQRTILDPVTNPLPPLISSPVTVVSGGTTDPGGDTNPPVQNEQHNSILLFPHVVLGSPVGGPTVTQLQIVNPNEQEWTGEGQVFNTSGSPWDESLAVNGIDRTGEGGLFQIQIPGNGCQTYILSSRSTSLQTGFLRLDGPPDKTVSASLLFRIMEGDYIKESVGIGPARAGTDFYIPIEDDDNVDTGIALAFLNEGEYSIRYVLYDDQGKVLKNETRLGSGFNHSSLMVRERFHTPLPSEFTGTLRVTITDGSAHAVAIRVDYLDNGQYHLTSVPAPPVR